MTGKQNEEKERSRAKKEAIKICIEKIGKSLLTRKMGCGILMLAPLRRAHVIRKPPVFLRRYDDLQSASVSPGADRNGGYKV
jgi:hypothetical protein